MANPGVAVTKAPSKPPSPQGTGGWLKQLFKNKSSNSLEGEATERRGGKASTASIKTSATSPTASLQNTNAPAAAGTWFGYPLCRGACLFTPPLHSRTPTGGGSARGSSPPMSILTTLRRNLSRERLRPTLAPLNNDAAGGAPSSETDASPTMPGMTKIMSTCSMMDWGDSSSSSGSGSAGGSRPGSGVNLYPCASDEDSSVVSESIMWDEGEVAQAFMQRSHSTGSKPTCSSARALAITPHAVPPRNMAPGGGASNAGTPSKAERRKCMLKIDVDDEDDDENSGPCEEGVQEGNSGTRTVLADYEDQLQQLLPSSIGSGSGASATSTTAADGTSVTAATTAAADTREILNQMTGHEQGPPRGGGGRRLPSGSINRVKSPRIGMLVMSATNGSPSNAAAMKAMQASGGAGGKSSSSSSGQGSGPSPHGAVPAPNGDFVFQPSPALKAARAVRDTTEPGKKESGEVGMDEGEAEGRVVYSSVGENFDLGGFTIGREGLVSSPRHTMRRRPSLNQGDNFLVMARLGAGNSGAVHKALHVPTMRLVALKALPLYDAERRAQVMRELRVLYSNLTNINAARMTETEPTLEDVEEGAADGNDVSTHDKKGGGEKAAEEEAAAVVAAQAVEKEEKLPMPNLIAAAAAAAAAVDTATTNGEDERKGEEAAVMERVHCPYIVSFYDAFADAKHGCLTLVVEYMNGGSLQDLVDRGGCQSEDILAHISYNVLMGLSFLHARHKIHRDIKPSNLLLNSAGFIKLADFGVSRSLDGSDGNQNGEKKEEGESQPETTDTFIGTVGYMSPERIMGQEYSYEADIWGFGLSVLACAVGAFPLQQSTPCYWGLVHAVCDAPAPEVPAHFSTPFRDFILRCLAKDPTQRPSSQELLQHPFITSRHHLHKDARGRVTEFPEDMASKQTELGLACKELATYLTQKQHEAEERQAKREQGWKEEQEQEQQGKQPQQPLGDEASTDARDEWTPPMARETMIQRLAEEVALDEEVVTETLAAAMVTAAKALKDKLAAAAAAALRALEDDDDWDTRGRGGARH